MSMLAIHANALGAFTAVYHEFLLRYKANDQVVYGFVEGKEDPMAYRGLIEQALPPGWEVSLLKSGNRDMVLETMKIFEWGRFAQRRICFFIDRDLSDLIPEILPTAQNLYVTDGYSLESEAIQFSTFSRILEEILNITEAEEAEVAPIKELFEKNRTAFTEAMCPVMAQILIWRRDGVKANLNDIPIKDFFEFDKGIIKSKLQFATGAARVQHSAARLGLQPASAQLLALAESEFRAKTEPYTFKHIRGKYSLWFVAESAVQFHKAVSTYCTKHPQAPKVKLSLGLGNAMVVIGPRIRCAESLRMFLQTNYLAYVTSVTTKSGWRKFWDWIRS